MSHEMTLRDQQEENQKVLKKEYITQRRANNFDIKWFYHVFIEDQGEVTMEFQEFSVKFGALYAKEGQAILNHFDSLYGLTIVFDKTGRCVHAA